MLIGIPKEIKNQEYRGGLPPELSLVSSSRDGVFIDTVKLADDNDRLVLRCYEGHNTRGRVELRIGRAVAGALEVNPGDVDVAQAVESSLRFVKERAAKAGIALKTEIAADLPILRADERMAKQMLIKLLTNADKVTGKGGKGPVSAALAGDGGVWVTVRVTGVGLARGAVPATLASGA